MKVGEDMHKFSVLLDWPQGRNAVGNLTLRHSTTAISIPSEMQGPNSGTNPDEMLLGAAATCYIISLAAMLEASGVVATLTMKSEGYVTDEKVPTYKKIIHRPCISLANPRKEGLARRIAEKAERSCMISRALHGNVDIALDITVTIQKEEG